MKRIGRSGLAGLAATGLVAGLLMLPHAATALAPGSPTPPGPLTVSGVTMNSANLTWTPATDTVSIEGYQVFRQAGGGASTLIATTDGGVNHYNATHLYASTNYTVLSPDGVTTSQGATLFKALTYACPATSCVLSVSGAPTGIGLATTSGGATSASLTIASGTGTVYVRGTVSASAPKKTYPVVLTFVRGTLTMNCTGNWVVQ